jgi:hypothetical protein
MTRIRCFADYCNFDSTIFYKIYGRQDDKIQFVNDDSYTHVIIVNKAMPNISHIPKENVIGFSYEPLELINFDDTFINYAQSYISRYFIGKTENLPSPFEEHYTFQCHNWADTIVKSYQDKPKIMSVMVSHKAHLPGHIYRINLAIKLSKLNIPVDIYGTGCNLLKSILGSDKEWPNIKGSFEKDEMLYSDYKYSIAIENTASNKYISEKLTNCFAHNTIPLYIGAEKAEEIFGGDCCIRLSGILDEDVNLIKNILEDPDKYKLDMSSFRDRLFNKDCCLIEFLKNIW